MAQIDLSLLVELLVALLVVATLDGPLPVEPDQEPPLEDHLQAGWTPEKDRHAQRILRLERRRSVRPAPLS